jgi:hypothetical protein
MKEIDQILAWADIAPLAISGRGEADHALPGRDGPLGQPTSPSSAGGCSFVFHLHLAPLAISGRGEADHALPLPASRFPLSAFRFPHPAFRIPHPACPIDGGLEAALPAFLTSAPPQPILRP